VLGIHGREGPGRQLLAAWPPANLFDGVGYGAALKQGQGKLFSAEEFCVAAEEMDVNGE
jgi:hypothetical protein